MPGFFGPVVTGKWRSRGSPNPAALALDLLLELGRRQIAEAHVRPVFVVVTPPPLDADLGFEAISKPFQAQTLVAELPVERFVGAILPGLARIDERGLDLRVATQRSIAVATNSEPLSDRR